MRSCDLPLGSPIMPVPPPTIAIGVWPNRCSRASPISGSRMPTCRLEAVGIEADVGGDRSRVEQRRPALRWRRTPARATSVRRSRFVMWMRFTISVDGRSPGAPCCKAHRRDRRRRRRGRRRVRLPLRTARARRHASDVPVSGLPPALAGLRIGLLTDVHRSRWVSARRRRTRLSDC